MQLGLFKTRAIYTITKKDLCNIMDRDGRWLRKQIFTDEVISDLLGITIKKYQHTKTFTFEQTKKIIRYLEIQDNELD
jgi:hypothetical protein